MNDQNILEVENLSLSFGGIKALQEVSLTVRKGEIFGLVGPNGAGKTCILNIVNGIYKQDSGKVTFKDEDITGIHPTEVVRLGIARSFQQIELFRGMTVRENLLVARHTATKSNIFSAGIFWGLARKEEITATLRVEEVLDFMELGRYRKQPAGMLPYGAQKLVGLARALCTEPKLILLDEPSSGMNREEKEDLARFLLRINIELGISILWIEHDIKLIGDLAERIAVIHYGRKIGEGPIEDILASPEVCEAYLGVTSESD